MKVQLFHQVSTASPNLRLLTLVNSMKKNRLKIMFNITNLDEVGIYCMVMSREAFILALCFFRVKENKSINRCYI